MSPTSIYSGIKPLGVAVLFIILFIGICCIPPKTVQAADFTVSNASELNQAIISANSNSEADTITLSSSITLTFPLDSISSQITIEGNGFALSGNNLFRVLNVTTSGELTIANITIANGHVSDQSGGGIRNAGILTATNSTFIHNSAIGVSTNSDGGGIYNNNGTAIISNCTFIENESSHDGGGIYNLDQLITIDNSTFINNSAVYGAGFINMSLEANSINNSTFSGNIAAYDGGGLRNNGMLTINKSTFNNNSATWGGGIFNSIDGAITVNNSTISGNHAKYGGGIHNNSIASSNSINDSTVFTNTATTSGGGIRNSGYLNLNHNIISGNNALNGAEYFQTTDLLAYTIADNFNVFAHSGLTNSQAYSANFLPGSNDYNASSTQNNISILNILNSTLADNGGPTLTHALVTGSPAIDIYTATCPILDQRGVERPWPNNGDCDSGAYELQYVNLIINSEHGSVELNPNLQTIQLGDVITLTANADPHYYFSSWSGDMSSIQNPLTITMTGNMTVTANFIPIEYTLDITSDHGIITREPDLSTYHYGDIVKITAEADPHWYLESWGGDFTSTENPAEIIINGDMTVTANYLPVEYTLTIISEQGIVTKDPDQPTYHFDDEVTLTVEADNHWEFYQWSGDLGGSSITETLTITGDMAVTANYLQIHFSLFVSQIGEGSVNIYPDSPYGDGYYEPGTVVTLTANAAPGWTFSGWTGDSSGITNPLHLTIEVDTDITAIFTQNEYTLEIYSDHGSVSLNPDKSTYHYGDIVTLTAIPDLGWSFKEWSGNAVGTKNPLEIIITSDTAIQANYILNEYTLSIAAINGRVIVNPEQPTYHFGDKVTITAVPDGGWSFSGWSGDLISTDNPIDILITSNMEIIALFEKFEIFLALVTK